VVSAVQADPIAYKRRQDWYNPAVVLTSVRYVLAFCGLVLLTACGNPEDPARIQLRERLRQQAPLSHEEIASLLDEVHRTVGSGKVRATRGGATADMDERDHDVVLGMLTNHAGVFDEGLRTIENRTLRVVNAPGRPSNAELDAARHLFIDIATFLPAHFEFTSGVASDEFVVDLVVEP